MVTLKEKSAFFDRQKVIDKVGKARASSLAHDGAYVRTRMRSNTGRSSKKSAAAGAFPKKHAGQIHDLIFFSLNSNATFVDVGPIPFGQGKAPGLLEFGGDTEITDHKTGKQVHAHYKGNPFAGPSLQEEIEAGNIMNAWKDSVR